MNSEKHVHISFGKLHSNEKNQNNLDNDLKQWYEVTYLNWSY